MMTIMTQTVIQYRRKHMISTYLADLVYVLLPGIYRNDEIQPELAVEPIHQIIILSESQDPAME